MKTSKLIGELVCDIYELTNKDRKNIQKLAREIEEGKGVAIPILIIRRTNRRHSRVV